MSDVILITYTAHIFDLDLTDISGSNSVRQLVEANRVTLRNRQATTIAETGDCLLFVHVMTTNSLNYL